MKIYRTGPETSRMMMRAMTVDDAEAFLALNGNQEVMRYTHEPLVRSLAEAKELLESYPDFDEVGFGRWGCYLKETQQMIGFCGLKFLADRDEIDVGYRLIPEYWGQGLATEAARASVEFGFEVLGLQTIAGLVLPENLASIRVLQKSGLIYEDEFYEQELRVLHYCIERNSD